MPAVNIRSYGTPGSPARTRVDSVKRVRILYGLLLCVCAVFVVRLFYLQVIRHNFYSNAALNYQLKEYQIPAERGVILARNGSTTTPLVLNEIKYTLFADPIYVKEPEKVSLQLAEITGMDAGELAELLRTPDTRYVVLAKELDKQKHEQIMALEEPGIGTREHSYRTYPQGALAAQVLGFVNDEGLGQYGIEQYLDKSLSGTPGELKAITDARGVPLVSNPDNVVTEPVQGESVTLTLDIGMQARVEELLAAGLERVGSKQGSVVVMDPDTGAVKAMANFPSFDPAKISEIEDLAALSNAAVTTPLEVGSIMKPFIVSAALEEGVISADTSFYNAGTVQVGDHTIRDVLQSQGTQSVESTLVRSLNTGAVWILKQIGRGDINERARLKWYDYMTRRFFFGENTGIEQAGEAAGYVPQPENTGQGIDVIYATTSFGQGLTTTLTQMAAGMSSLVNGGTYYQPRLVESVRKDGREQLIKPIVRHDNVVGDAVSEDMRRLLERVVQGHLASARREGYQIGGKTGTAEIFNPETGKYYADRFNGTYLGFVGGDRPEYVIAVLVREPKDSGNAGLTAAAPIFRDVSNMLLDNFGVTPKGSR